MIIGYSKNPFRQFAGVLYNNRRGFLFFTICALIPCVLNVELGLKQISLPGMPVTLLGGALAIFLGFRNSSAYDRWWEARKVWGEIVNNSRMFGVQVLTYSDSKEKDKVELEKWRKEIIYRHIAWVNALKLALRRQLHNVKRNPWLTSDDKKQLKSKSNIPAQILAIQGQQIKYAFDHKWIEDFRQYELMHSIQNFYDSEGKCERIKNTVFPFYFNYFTRIFLWIFVICLPFALVDIMGWMSIPMSIAISFVFTILDKSGLLTEEPFRGIAADTPLDTIARGIEIDLREMINDEDIPGPIPVTIGRFGVRYRK
ncbi:MAG: bestrophin family protein [Reichenbachiella sp.]